jgi:dTDP-4-dehydrorhamnose reductase
VVATAEEMSTRIAIVGAGGRLGAALAREWKRAGEEVIPLARTDLDLADPARMESLLGAMDFGVLVNCAALTNVDHCEKHPEEAMRINAQAVRTLGEVCARRRARCIHISTDYVFDGEKSEPYTEEDDARPVSHYGESKLAGEIALLDAWDRHLVVRVSWVFGPDRPSFVDQILQRARTEEHVAAVADKIAVPTYTLDAAALLRPFLFEVPVGGIVHLCNTGDCTWQEYGQHALDCAQAAGLELRTHTVEPQKMADIKAFIARRPPYTVMSTRKLTNLTGLTPRPWREAVRSYVGLCR